MFRQTGIYVWLCVQLLVCFCAKTGWFSFSGCPLTGPPTGGQYGECNLFLLLAPSHKQQICSRHILNHLVNYNMLYIIGILNIFAKVSTISSCFVTWNDSRPGGGDLAMSRPARNLSGQSAAHRPVTG